VNSEELTQLNNNQLGLISVKDLDELESMAPDKRKAYVGRIAAVWDLIEKELENAIRLQVDYAIRQAKSWEDVLVARGSINGLAVILERFSKLNQEHFENTKPKEKFDKHEVI